MKPDLTGFYQFLDKDLTIVSADNQRFVAHQLVMLQAFGKAWGEAWESQVGHLKVHESVMHM